MYYRDEDHRMLHRVFITYHHENDQDYKESLVRIGEEN